jgi:hypothetical protein
MRGGWATLRVTIIAAVVPFAKLANTRSVDHLEGKFLIILKVVEDHGVGLGEGLSLRGLKSSQYSYKIAPFLDATGSNTERSSRTRVLAVIARR